MTQNDLLYVKGMNSSDTELEEDIWDDRKLTDAYDKALKMANIEVAKRMAMQTNSQGNKDGNFKNKKGKGAQKPSSSKKDVEWKVGMPCRAVYKDDGLEYEAVLLSIINNNECVVKYLGYENSEIVSINMLKPSLGNEERTRQIECALHEEEANTSEGHVPNGDVIDVASDKSTSLHITEKVFQKKKTSHNKKKRSGTSSSFQLPEINMPNLSMLNNLGSMEMPMAPPPPLNFMSRDRSGSEEQAISSMLLSWYMSGYYTGLYQGMKKAKENRTNLEG